MNSTSSSRLTTVLVAIVLAMVSPYRAAGDRRARGEGGDVGDAGQDHQGSQLAGEELDRAPDSVLARRRQAVGGESADDHSRRAEGEREEDVGAGADPAVEQQRDPPA